MKTVLKTCMTSKVKTGNIKTTFKGTLKTRLRGSPIDIEEFRLLEDGFYRLIEDGNIRLLQ